MIPIQTLLSRIRWDRDFGQGQFVIGYRDRVSADLVHVPLARIAFDADSHYAFDAIEDDGSVHSVPYHRVREVYRNGVLIWHRPEPKLPHQH